jgi:hypothetical protein
MKHSYIIIFVILLVIASCKKENKSLQGTSSSGSSVAPTLEINSIPDSTGYQRIYNVIYREIKYLGNQTPTVTLKSSSVYTTTTIGDTLLPSNVIGKNYLYTFSDTNYLPFKAFSFFDSTDLVWILKPLGYHNFIKPISIKLPLQIGDKWFLQSFYGDSIRTENLWYEQVQSSNKLCYKVTGRQYGVVNFQTYNYQYFIYPKGIVKYYFNNVYYNNSTSVTTYYQFEISLLNCNF